MNNQTIVGIILTILGGIVLLLTISYGVGDMVVGGALLTVVLLLIGAIYLYNGPRAYE